MEKPRAVSCTARGVVCLKFIEIYNLIAGDPSVLTADKVCKIWVLRVSRRMVVFDKCELCRKPAPFGKGWASMPDIERPKFRKDAKPTEHS